MAGTHGGGGQVARRGERSSGLGSDTSVIGGAPPKDQLDEGTSFNPVHIYLLARQGVHVLEYQNLEHLAEDKVYKFAYILGVNKIRGTAAGTVLRPIGIV